MGYFDKLAIKNGLEKILISSTRVLRNGFPVADKIAGRGKSRSFVTHFIRFYFRSFLLSFAPKCYNVSR